MMIRWSLAALAAALAVPAIVVADEDHAHVARISGIEVVHAWSRATNGPDGVLFMEIENHGGDDVLIGASTAIAASVELHGTRLQDGETDSEPIGEMPIAAGGELELEPNALFFKLEGLNQALVEGGHYEVELHFAEAGSGIVEVEIEAADATQHSHAGHAH
jgi:periplasmic copper chaperone A